MKVFTVSRALAIAAFMRGSSGATYVTLSSDCFLPQPATIATNNTAALRFRIEWLRSAEQAHAIGWSWRHASCNQPHRFYCGVDFDARTISLGLLIGSGPVPVQRRLGPLSRPPPFQLIFQHAPALSLPRGQWRRGSPFYPTRAPPRTIRACRPPRFGPEP